MKLAEKIINSLDFKEKKNNSLISSIEKIKYQDLITISHVIDNSKFLNGFSSGWNAIQYAVLNDAEVLFFIANLYIKNHCDLNQFVQKAKNTVPKEANTLDIAISNQKLEQYIILKNLGITEHKNYSFYLSRQNKRHLEEKKFQSLNLPYEYSLINLFTLNFQYVGLDLLKKDNLYEEKEQYIFEFLTNHEYICKNYLNHSIFSDYDNFFDSIIKLKNEISINCFDFFIIPFIESFKIKKEKMDYSFFNNLKSLYGNNLSDFFNDLQDSKFKEESIIVLQEMLLMSQSSNPAKNITSFIEEFNIDKFLFSLELDKKLASKNTLTKITKI